MRRTVVLGALLLLGPSARAEEAAEEDGAKFRVGVNVGILSVPRLVNLQGYARVHPYIGLGGGWSTMPKFASDLVLKWAGATSDTTTSTLNEFSAWEVFLRMYPLRGVFYLGVGFGQQVVDGQVTALVAGLPFGPTGSGRVQSWVLTPRIGWQWVWSSGFALGLEAGVQVTVSHQDTVTLPPGTPPDVIQETRDLVNFGANVPLPVVNFTIGYHFG
ncbi:MAG TPA: hypothetical protein VLQ79_13315 [Myxococcaceae bacterium]|nr:hypothetical protein [Myxococcaceae bacterium]